MTSALMIENLYKSFGKAPEAVQVLDNANLEVPQGQSLALTGDSGSGKSTLLHICAGLEPFDRGKVVVAGHDITQRDDAAGAALRRGTIGLVFQQFNLIPSLTVAANLAFQARLAGRYDPAFVNELAQRLGIAQFMSRYPEQLSGGQQQRVAIGRCLAARPRLVLADEPTGNLDEATGDAVLDLMLELAVQAGTALLLVTHSTRLASRCDARVHLRAGRLQVPA
ncbi:ABC transporter ATP-binding protein [Roseinatronobacter sp.]